MRNRPIAVIVLMISSATAVYSQAQGTINTVAGGVPNNVPAVSVGFLPQGVFEDSAGNFYIASGNTSGSTSCIYKVSPSGQLTTVAGDGTYVGFSGDGGPATKAQLDDPEGVFVDAAGDIFIADTDNSRVREVVASTGIITTVAGGGAGGGTDGLGDGGLAVNAALSAPEGVFVDAAGDIFIADTGNSRIREVVASTGIINTVAGNGTVGFGGDGALAVNAELSAPTSVFVDTAEDIYIADTGNDRIREVAASNLQINTVAGGGGFSGMDGLGDGGPALSAQFHDPQGVFVDTAGDIFIADTGDDSIREVLASTGIINIVAGNGVFGFSGDGGPATSAELSVPQGVFVDTAGDIFIADTLNFRIREAVASTGDINTIAGNGTFAYSGDGGPATSAELSFPESVFEDSAGDIFIADTDNSRIREVVASTGTISTIAGNGTFGYSGDGGPATSAELSYPEGVFVDAAGDVFIADTDNSVIREVVASTGKITTVAGGGEGGGTDGLGDGGLAINAELDTPTRVFVDAAGDIFIADTGSDRIREVVASTGIITTVAGGGEGGGTDGLGDGGLATSAELSFPEGVFVDATGDIFIADSSDSRIREVVATTGIITTVVGGGDGGGTDGLGDGGLATNAELIFPQGVYLDPAGNIFIADSDNSRIREVVASTGIITSIAGNGTPGFSGDGGPATNAELFFPPAVWSNSAGNVVIADELNNRIRGFSVPATSGILPPTVSVAFSSSIVPLASSTVTVTFTINNPNASNSLSGVGFTDTFPATVIVSGPASGSCGAGTITEPAGTHSVVLTGGTLVAAGSCTFSVSMTPSVAGTISDTTGNITSTEGGTGATSNTATLTVLAPPTVTLLSPNSGSIGTTITITGTNFGASQAQVSGTISFNGTLVGAAASWSPTSITVNVPAGATTGNVMVTILGVASATSSSTLFTVSTSLPSSCAGAPSGQESALNGQWAVLAQGWQGTGPGSPAALVFNFSANGHGLFNDVTDGMGITGNVDRNFAAGGATSALSGNVLTAGSSYSVGLDPINNTGYVGCMTLAFSSGSPLVYYFSLSVTGGTAIEGHIVRWTDTSGVGSGIRTTGVMLPQDPTAFSSGTLANMQPNYAFGEDGTDIEGGHLAEEGTVSLNTATGAFSGIYDANDAGSLTTDQTISGTITGLSAQTGRALSTSTTEGDATPNHVALYFVNANEFFVVGIDPFNTADVIYSGRGIVTGTSFSNTSLSGNYVAQSTGSIANGSCGNATCSIVSLGVLSFSNGSMSTASTIYNYTYGTAPQASNPGGTVQALPSGRMTIDEGPVFYLVIPQANTEPIAAFFASTGSSATFGTLEAGANANLSTSSAAGNYIFGNIDPGDSTVGEQIGVANVTSGGNITGYQYKSGISGLTDGSISGDGTSTLNITNTPLPGFATIGSGTIAVTNGSRTWFIDNGINNDSAARITTIEPATLGTVDFAPAITSANNTTFTVGSNGTFTVTTTGNPVAALTETGSLPSGVTFTDNGNGTATIAGIPAAGTANSYPITITAKNEIAPNAVQSFTLHVALAPLPPTISKAFNVVSLPLGGSTTLTFTLNNPNSASALTGVGFGDTFPVNSGLQVATPVDTNNCGGTPNGVQSGSTSVTLSGVTLTASETCTFVITVTGTSSGTINNITGNVTSNEGGTGGTSNTASLIVLAPPAIISLSTHSGPVGDPITIAGANFGTAQGSSTVTVNGVTAAVTSWSSTSITVTVPAGATGTGNVVVTVFGVTSTINSATDFTVTTSSLPASCSGAPSGQESVLNGRWVVMEQGWTGTDPGSPSAFLFNFDASGGSFVDVSGGSGITGNVDHNLGSGGASSVFSGNVLTAGSSYNVGLDPTNNTGYVGCMTLALSNGNTVVYRFALSVANGSAVRGRIIRWTDTNGTGGRTSGVMLPQDATAFSGGTLASLKPNYAYGYDGTDLTGGHAAQAGTVNLNTTTGVFTSINDTDDAGSVETDPSGGGSIANPSAQTGRAVITGTGGSPTHIAMYVVNANELFIIGIDPYVAGGSGIYSGRAIATGTSFSTNTLSGNYIAALTGSTIGNPSCNGSGPCATVALGVLNFAAGTLTPTIENYTQGTAISTSTGSGTYSVAPSGRVSTTGAGTHPPVLYLATPQSNTEPIVAFIVGTDSPGTFGFMEAGANSNVIQSSLAGKYIFGSLDPGDSTVNNSVGVATLDGSGNVTGFEFDSDTGGLVAGGLSGAAVTIANSPLPGFGTGGSTSVALTNGRQIWLLDTGTEDSSPASIGIIEPATPATAGTAPAITSANSVTFTVGVNGTFTVTTTGSPIPALTETGLLPNNVTFTDNGNGTASIAGIPAAGTAGSYPITITANNGIAPNGVQTFTLNVVAAPSITSFAAAAPTIASGGSTTLTAVFSGGTGSVNNGVGPVTSGTAVTISPSATTTYTLTVTNAATTPATVTAMATVTVLGSPTVVSLSANSGAVGTPITITGTNFGAAQGSSTVTVNGVTATATSWSPTTIVVTVPATATGTGNVVVIVSGVSSATSASTSFTVSSSTSLQLSATALATSLNPSSFGQLVTFTAPVDGAGTGTPTGTVTFLDNGVQIGTGTIVNGQAIFSTSFLSIGSHPITATYGGNASFSPSTSNVVTQMVNPSVSSTPGIIPTFIAVSSTPNPALVGATVAFTATVSSGSSSGTPPSGNVTFLDSGVSIGVGVLSSAGVATVSTSALNACSNPITAQYSGDANYASSSSVVLVELVGSCTPPVSVTITPNPQNVVSNEIIQFGATVLGATNTAVTWAQLSGPGTLSATGQYTAPNSSSSTATITIAATSLADTGASTFIQFTLAADALTTNSQAPATITAGQTLSVTINLAGPPASGPNSTVPFTLSCGNLPVATTCVFTPPTVTGANPQFTVMIVTSGGSSSSSSSHLGPLPPQSSRPWYALFALLLPALAMVGLRRGVFFERHSYACLVLVLLCLATVFLASCTGFSPAPITSVSAPVAHALTPSGAFQLVVTASPGANSGNFVQTQLIVPITVN